jgi:hypothetical protein
MYSKSIYQVLAMTGAGSTRLLLGKLATVHMPVSARAGAVLPARLDNIAARRLALSRR